MVSVVLNASGQEADSEATVEAIIAGGRLSEEVELNAELIPAMETVISI